ncbi:hypothetical protein RO3G_02492 [Rhizopus delemar RA 99-880]|uniref:Uncharacterized protein n=1 Tax=Rhizopus delemar (strain RA 99-880 / ATCC MYA-4621 / FGSC 9543 / NRRL 43880) TaxID=246409 RepID=I1BNK8_RHIO9|nr:hypothetical protein RO3G_02492 [Rhizopus delemar RA 99-880]|eukprot:EIE77788.1 hypothetical protein RO3G_02492 [Rhizopus delemar RA 99-880]
MTVSTVVTNGFFGSVDGRLHTAFLGYHIHNPPKLIAKNFKASLTNMIFVSTQQNDHILKNRMMN